MTDKEYAARLLGDNVIRGRFSYKEPPRWPENNGVPLSANWREREAEIDRLSHETTSNKRS